jgi:2-polyprenyl-3-methyl-5-hydroxy-6-metoxy-1,4-benzoquinol methylase
MSTEAIPTTKARDERWKEEAHFFDTWAERVDDAQLYMDPLAWKRYSNPHPRRRFNKEFRLRVLGNLKGRKVLDVGCGDGLNVVTLAKLGAQVTGLDVSSGAVRVAERRAALAGVSERVSLTCSPVETADFRPDTFDVVWGEGILHHVLAELELVMQHLVRWTKPGGLLIFSEPLNLNHTLRGIRQRIPVVTEATPDERPLVRGEIELLRRYIPNLTIRHFNLFGRLDAFILTSFNYERSSAVRRAAVNVTSALDYALLSVPGLKNLGGAGVLYGQPIK